MKRLVLFFAALALLIAVTDVPLAIAQDKPQTTPEVISWLAGVWKGTQTADQYTSPLTITVATDGSWKLDLLTARSGRVGGSGKVEMRDGVVVLRGLYDAGPSYLINRPLVYELERSGEDILIGWGQGVAERTNVKLKKDR